MNRSLLRRSLLAVLAAGLLPVALPRAAGAEPPPAPTARTAAEAAARGLRLDGLTAADPRGECRGLYELRAGGRLLGCTHGPDPAPPGVDVRRPVATTDLLRRSGLTLGAEADGPAAAPERIACIGDGTTGKRVQVIYARASNVASRYSALVPVITNDVSAVNEVMNASAAETGGKRQVRFVTSSCALSILNVTLSTSGDDTFTNTVNELRAKGYTRTDRKYLVFVDANVYCGMAEVRVDDQPGAGNQSNGVSSVPGEIARIDSGCWGQLPLGHANEAHELGHLLGAVQPSAPHATGLEHCSDEYDTMCYQDGTPGEVLTHPCQFGHDALYDCGHNDYFSTAPAPGSYLATHWNVANSGFLSSTLAPLNDAFATPQAFAPASTSWVGSNVGASGQTGEPATAGQGASHSVWYQVTAPSGGGTLTVDTQNSSFDTVLGVYTGGGVASLTQKAANDNAKSGATYSRVSLATVGGTTYRIKVDGKGGATGAIALHIGFGGPGPVFTGFSPTSGPVGTVVTMTGTNLIGNGTNIRLLFNGVPITGFLSGTTASTLKMVVPPGAVSGPIILNTAWGFAQTTSSFTVK